MKSYKVTLLQNGVKRFRSIIADDEGEAVYKAKQEILCSTLINVKLK